MKFRRFLRQVAFSPVWITGVWILLVLVVWKKQWLNIGAWELSSYNYRFGVRGTRPPDNRIVFLGIDDASILGTDEDDEDIKKNPGYAYIKEFPYQRRAWALATEKLIQCGAKVVVFDLVLSHESPLGPGPEGKADDDAFAKVLAKYHDKIVIGANFTEETTGNSLVSSTEALVLPSSTLLPSGNEKLSPKERVPDKEIVGYVNYHPDPDGFIRRINPVGWPYSQDAETLPYSIDALAVQKAYPHVKLPDPFASRFIQFAGPNGTYPAIPFYLMFSSEMWEKGKMRPPLLEGKIFKDKIVLIGPRANIFHDEHATPLGVGVKVSMFGPEIHCNAMATLLSGRNLREARMAADLWIIALGGALFALFLRIPKSPLGKLVPAVGAIIFYIYLCQKTFEGFDLFIAEVPILVLIVGSTFSVVTLQAIAEQIEKRRVSSMFQSYVSRNVAEELIKSGQDVGSILAPRRREVTVLFSDIRDFTTMTEANDPGPFVQQLNEYLTAMVECVFNNHGTLDKFVGDAVMAVFGNPTSLGAAEDAWCAVKTAVEMRQRLAGLNARWEKEGKPVFKIGIGLNHGPVMAGDIGSRQKREFGVIGDAVNLASRVEGLTKTQKTDILISETVFELVGERLNVEERGDVQVKGRVKLVKVYAVKSLKASPDLTASKIRMKFD